MLRSLLAGGVTVLGLLALPASADTKYFVPATSYIVPVGSTIDVPVYLDISDPDASSLLIDNNGLYSASATIVFDSGTLGAADVIDAFAGSDFDDPFPSISVDTPSGEASVIAFADGTGAYGTNLGGTYRLQIAVFRFLGAATGVTTFRTDTFGDSLGFETWDNAVPFDATNEVSFSITVVEGGSTAVPLPPAVWAGMGLLGTIAGVRYARRARA